MPPGQLAARIGFARFDAGGTQGGLAVRRGGMDSEERRHADGTTERPSGSRGADSLTIGELARDSGVTLRALRFYQSKGLLAPRRNGSARLMLSARDRGCVKALPIGRRKCVEQINLLERQRRDIDGALAELRQIYTEMFIASELSRAREASVSRKA